MQSICVFCGSSPGARAEYAAAARSLGARLATDQIRLVYGGASVGLMGAVADAVLAGGGFVTGVIPRSLVERELAHGGLTELRVVETMHERKAQMTQISDGFIALPGGFGTFDELFEVLSWAQLGIHRKPIGLLNVSGFFDPLIAALDHSVGERFVRPAHRDLLVAADRADVLLERLRAPVVPTVPKWLDFDDA